MREPNAMSLWKRLSAATSNLTIGSPIAKLLAGDGEAENTSNRLQSSEKPDNEVPFTLGIIALSAKMAKADGRVTRDEVEAFKGAFRVCLLYTSPSPRDRQKY